MAQNVFTYHYANCTHLVSITYCNDTDDSIGLVSHSFSVILFIIIITSIYFTFYQVVVTFLVPSIIMIICYSTVIKSLWRATQKMAVMTHRYRYTTVQVQSTV